MSPLVYLAIGLVIGLALGWLLALLRRPAAAGSEPLLAELRQQLAHRDGELQQLRSELAQAQTTAAAELARREAADQLLAEQRALHERALAEARAVQDRAIADLREAFRALSADALRQTTPEFLRLANETLSRFHEMARGDLAQRQQAIATLIRPLEEHLRNYQQRLQQSENAQAGALGEVKRQLELLAAQSSALAQETQQFRMVLRSNQARGRWGEETLRRVVEAAGMSAHCDFTEQSQGDEGKPDMIVRLPGGRVIIVDSKVPDLDVLNAVDNADPLKRAELLAAHAAKLKNTIRSLAERDYPAQFPNALDYVVLFLPAESLFSAALEGDHDLIVWAAGKRILLATPASLIALLRSVAVSWQQHAQTENAQKIAEAAQEFYARVVKFTEHFEKIGAGLDRASAAFNDAVASFQSRVRPAGERLAELGGGAPGRELADLQPQEHTPRLPPAN
jgi:DNA recombination protein RmuC